MLNHYWNFFAELICTSFQHLPLVWGIVPLYFGLLLSELTPGKASFRTAIQTGFSFLWAAAQWLYPYFQARETRPVPAVVGALPAVNLCVTLLVLGFGTLALYSGLRRRFPKYGTFLGHTRFSNYFMIAIFPMQAHMLAWTWERLGAIALFALPVWLLLHFGLMPLRR